MSELLAGYYAVLGYGSILTLPPLVNAFKALASAAELQSAWEQEQMRSIERIAALGFPPVEFIMGAHALAPFDYIGDHLRGMRGIFLDMRRCPEKILALERKVIPFQVEAAISTCRARKSQYVFFPLHRGSDGFISLQQFERLYWPQLKEVMLKVIDAGLTPYVFWEGCWNDRLKYLAELPKGKTVGMFEKSDIFKVKEVLGETMCIVGGMPVSMLMAGTVSEVREHSRRLCQIVGQGGGFIMCTDIGEMEGCNPELVAAWAQAPREYGAV